MTVYVMGDVEYHPDEDVCPWCGGFFEQLVEWSGWCNGCTSMFLGQSEPSAHCASCDAWKPVDDFGKQADGRPRVTCRACETRKRREWRQRNPEKEREALERTKAKRRARREAERDRSGTVAA